MLPACLAGALPGLGSSLGASSMLRLQGMISCVPPRRLGAGCCCSWGAALLLVPSSGAKNPAASCCDACSAAGRSAVSRFQGNHSRPGVSGSVGLAGVAVRVKARAFTALPSAAALEAGFRAGLKRLGALPCCCCMAGAPKTADACDMLPASRKGERNAVIRGHRTFATVGEVATVGGCSAPSTEPKPQTNNKVTARLELKKVGWYTSHWEADSFKSQTGIMSHHREDLSARRIHSLLTLRTGVTLAVS